MSMVVAVGALGGSGTRVVAQILSQLGIFIGDDLNDSVDNLLYTRLFKDVEWYKNASKKDIDKRHSIFEKCMTNKKLTFKEKWEWYTASRVNVHIKSTKSYYKNIFSGKNKKTQKPIEHWGWKEPNSHIYIEDIHRFYKNIKYIYVIRHGLDMAYSNNLQQVNNWGFLFDISIHEEDDKSTIASKQLNYWIKSSERAKQIGEDLYKENFYVLNHQELCENPSEEIKKLIQFLGLSVSDEILNQVVELPKVPSTNKRYKNEDLSIFSEEQLEKVKSFGFTV